MTPGIAGVRIALLGNTANCLLPLTVALREAGAHADLFVDEHAPLTGRPESADARLAEVEWVRRGPWLRPWSVLVPWWSPVVRELRGYDVLLVSGPGPVYAQWSGRPYLWWASGHDLTAAPFPFAFRHLYRARRRRLAAYPLALWQRRGARRAHDIWVQPFGPFQDAVERLRLTSPPVSKGYLPLIVDLDPDQEARAVPAEVSEVTDRMRSATLAVFHPSALRFVVDPAERRAGQWKGNDRMIEGFAAFVERTSADVVLVMPEIRSQRDLPHAKSMVERLGIGDHVVWARPPRPEGFTRAEMLALYEACDVVADEFAAGWFGYVALEGLAMGRPVISHVDANGMQQLYPHGHPFVSCVEPSAIADRLLELMDPRLREELGARGQAWIAQHHTREAASARYVSEVSAALRKR